MAGAGLAADADAEATRIGQRQALPMARGAGQGAVLGEGGFLKELFPQRDALDDERIVARQIRHGKRRAHLEAVGRESFRQVKRFWMGGGHFRFGHHADALDAEGARQVAGQRGGNGVAVARVRGRTVARQGESARPLEEGAEVEVHFEFRLIADGERRGQDDGGAMGVARQMIRPAVELAGGVAPQTFQRQENIAPPASPNAGR